MGHVEVVFADTGAQGSDQGANFLVGQHLVIARLFDVEDFAPEGQNGLEAAVPALFGGAAGRFALHQEELAALGVLLLAVGQLARQAAGVQRALTAGQVAGAPRSLAGSGRFNGLAHDFAHDPGVLVEILAQLVIDKLDHGSLDIAVQLTLGLPSNCGWGILMLTTAVRPSRTSSPLRFSLTSLKRPACWP